MKEKSSVHEAKYQNGSMSLKEYTIIGKVLLKNISPDELEKISKRKLRKNSIWNKVLKNFEGISPFLGLALITLIDRPISYFNNFEAFKHFMGIVPSIEKNDFSQYRKILCFMIADNLIENNDEWKGKFKEIIEQYSNREPDWKEDKIEAYSRKKLAQWFLQFYYNKLNELNL